MSVDPLLRPDWQPFRGQGRFRAKDLLIVLLLLAATSLLGKIFARELGETRLTMLYLPPVLIAAVVSGVWAALLTAIIAVALLNFLFAEPHYSLFVSDYQDLLTLFLFFLVAGTTGFLAGRLREERDDSRANARALRILSEASERLHAAKEQDEVLALTADALTELTEAPVVILSREGDGPFVTKGPAHAREALQEADFHAADLALRHGVTEVAAAAGWMGSAYSFLPVRFPEGGTEGIGQEIVLGLARPATGESGDHYREPAAEVLRQQCSLALQRLQFADQAAEERARASEEALRAGLLTSLSHDLRSPLAGILGSVTTLRDLGAALPEAARADLLSGIESETRRLAAYVANLLKLTRLQSGSPPAFQEVSLREAAASAAARLVAMWPEATLEQDLPDLPPILGDAALLEQAVFNLLDNAMRHAGGPITIRAEQRGGRQMLTVSDQGVRAAAAAPDRAPAAGAGLGLRICDAIARVLGGEMVTAANGLRGRSVTLSFPAAPQQK